MRRVLYSLAIGFCLLRAGNLCNCDFDDPDDDLKHCPSRPDVVVWLDGSEYCRNAVRWDDGKYCDQWPKRDITVAFWTKTGALTQEQACGVFLMTGEYGLTILEWTMRGV